MWACKDEQLWVESQVPNKHYSITELRTPIRTDGREEKKKATARNTNCSKFTNLKLRIGFLLPFVHWGGRDLSSQETISSTLISEETIKSTLITEETIKSTLISALSEKKRTCAFEGCWTEIRLYKSTLQTFYVRQSGQKKKGPEKGVLYYCCYLGWKDMSDKNVHHCHVNFLSPETAAVGERGKAGHFFADYSQKCLDWIFWQRNADKLPDNLCGELSAATGY